MRKRELENIRCSAIWVDTGEACPPRRSYNYPKTGLLFCGLRHSDCFTALQAWSELLPAETKLKLKSQIAGINQGFLTSKGRYVDRTRAKIIAVRREQCEDNGREHLFSEDLY